MELVVITTSLMVFLLAVIIFSPVGRAVDNKRKRINTIDTSNDNINSYMFEESFYKRFILPFFGSVFKTVAKLIPKSKNNNTKNEQLEKTLRLAGIFISAQEYSSIKILVTGLISGTFLILALLFGKNPLVIFMIILFGLMLAILVPNYYLKAKASSRQNKIKQQMPDVLDLLVVCIEAGLSFDSSLVKISDKMSGPFVDELLILHREIQLGRPRKDALRNLGDCSIIPELKTFSSSMAQAEQLGIPINNVLKIQASQLRLTRKQQAQEKGMKAPVKMMLPMVLFIFPVVFIILLGPTVIQIIKEFT